MSTPFNPPFKVKTKVSWAGEEEGDLGFVDNEIIDVFAYEDSNWWIGKLRRNKKEGVFPKDYVEVIEPNLSHSGSNLSLSENAISLHTSPMRQQVTTPIKDYDYRSSKSGTPNGYFSKSGPKKYNPDNSYDFEANQSFDTSFDGSAKKGRHQMISKVNHPKYKSSQEDRDREIEYYKKLQQQDVYPIQQQPNQAYRNSVGPDANYSKKTSKSKPRTQSQVYELFKSHSYSELPEAEKYSSDRYSPERSTSEYPRKSDGKYKSRSKDEIADEVIQKNAHLEKKVRELTKALHKSNIDGSIDSLFISEGIISSKVNYGSRDDLEKKLYNDEYDSRYRQQTPPPARYESPPYEVVSPGRYEVDSPPPPPPPKHNTPMKSYNYAQDDVYEGRNDFRHSGSGRPLSDEELYRLSLAQQEELKNSMRSMQSDVLNLSELSATSAGSFFRHKYEKQMRQQDGRGIEDTEEAELSKSKQQNIFQKMLKKKDDVNPIEMKLRQQEDDDWATLKLDVNRMNSLTSQDKQARTRRIVREEGNLIVKPLDYISDINTNEVLGEITGDDVDEERIVIDETTLKKIDVFMSHYQTSSDLNEMISDVSVKFNNSKINQTRCILVHLCKFHIIEELNKILQAKPKLNEVLSKGEATIYQINYLFKKILDALRIPSEVVLGFWKKPNEFYHNEQFFVNHCWLSVLIDKKFLIMDTYCFRLGSVCNVRTHPNGFNEYYFLAKPLKVVSTHIPSVIDLQHVLPPVDLNVAFYLPRAYSGFYKSKLRFRNFNNALTRLKDLEFFELELEVPVDVELFSLVKTSKITTNELSLCQIKWSNNKRYAKVKAILPENESIGVLQIFAGPKGLQNHFENIHELAIVIPLYHSGSYKPTKFVPRFPTVQSQNNDLYVKSPQTSKIVPKNAYNFEILQYPSMGLNSGSGLMNLDFKIVIESPSGKYFKLVISDPSKPFGSYECNIKCQEVGLYRGLVIGDGGNSWYVFSQWECSA